MKFEQCGIGGRIPNRGGDSDGKRDDVRKKYLGEDGHGIFDESLHHQGEQNMLQEKDDSGKIYEFPVP